MRKIGVLILPLVILGGCRDSGSTIQASSVVFRIDLQSQFQDDSVRVLVDGRSVFEGRVTTNYSISLAKSVSVDVSPGQHNVLVQVVHPYTGTDKDTTVVAKDTMTVAVNLDGDSSILS